MKNVMSNTDQIFHPLEHAILCDWLQRERPPGISGIDIEAQLDGSTRLCEERSDAAIPSREHLKSAASFRRLPRYARNDELIRDSQVLLIEQKGRYTWSAPGCYSAVRFG